MKTLIVGIGNILYGDEGVGVHAVDRLQRLQLPADIDVIDGGTVGIELVNYFGSAEKIIVIDAVKADAPPGTIVRFSAGDYVLLDSVPSSAHDSSLSDILAFATSSIDLTRIVVIGMVPEDVQSMSLTLSKSLSDALPRLIDEVLAEVGKEAIHETGSDSSKS